MSHPPMSWLVPHAGRMRLLRDVVEHSSVHTVCAVDPAKSALFRDADGTVPAFVGLEYMAQCVAAHGGLLARAAGAAPRPALLLGSRRLAIRVDRFEVGQSLLVSARHHRSGPGIVAFDCEVRDAAGGRALVEGRLSVHPLPEDAEGGREGAGGATGG